MAAVTGLDVGHRTVRACVVERNGRVVRLKACGEVSRLDEAGEPKPLAAAIAELDAKVQFRGPVVAAVSDISALVRFVSTLPLPPDRLARLLRLELSQHVDGSGDLAADTMVVPIPSDELMHLCVLAQPAQVYSALIDLREAGVRSPQVHFGPAAAYNATLPLPPVRDSALALLIDVGSATTGITLFGEDRLLACRQVPVGGDTFTEAMVAAGRDRGAAERSKREPRSGAPAPAVIASDDPFAKMLDSGLELHDDTPAPPAAAQDPGESAARPASGPLGAIGDHEEIVIEGLQPSERAIVPPAAAAKPPATRPTPPPARADELDPSLARPAEALFGQIVSSLTWFKSQLKLRSIDLKLVCLAGGGGALPGLDAYLQRRLSIPVQLLDPFAGLEGGLRPERAHEFTAAFGLALADRSFHFRHAARFDLRPDTLVRKELWRTRLAWPFVAAALLVAATIFGMLALRSTYEAQRESTANDNAYIRDYKAKKQRLDDLDSQKAALSEDLRAITSRIYAGRDLLYTIRALKERTDQSPQLWVTKLVTHAVGQDANTVGEQREHGNIVDSQAPRDTAIDRGAVDISGLVKFDSAQKDPERVKYFNDWKEWILDWTPDGTSRLFYDARTVVLAATHDEHATDPKKPAGEAPWSVTFYYTATDLSQVTSVRPASSPPAEVQK